MFCRVSRCRRRVLAAAILVFSAGGGSVAHAQAFATRFSVNETGDIALIGNTLLTCTPAANATCAAAQAGTATGANLNNNNHTMTNVDVDTDATTANSSRATLNLPTGASVLWAGLYWGASSSSASRTTVRFSTPATGGYVTLAPAWPTILVGAVSNDYEAFANVTPLVAAGGNGAYQVAGVQANVGANLEAGWALVVAYRAPGLPPRNLAVFDGFASVSSGPVAINVSGFTTPPAGPVVSRVGIVAYEGDLGTTGDVLRLNATPLINAVNPNNNFFNSTVSNLGSRITTKFPNYANQLGFDIDLVDATGILVNGATSATLNLTTTGDVYYPGVVTFATDLYAPVISAPKTVTDLNGGLVEPGDVLEYNLTLTNTGQDGALNVVLTDPIPAATTYVPGSLEVVAGANAGPKTDGPGDDQAEQAAPNLVFRLGTGANATAGGTLAPAASTSVRFRVQINAGTPNATLVQNQAAVAFSAQTLGTVLGSSSGVAATPVVVPVLTLVKSDGPDPVQAGGQVVYTLTYGNVGSAPATNVILSDSLPSNSVFVSATGGASVVGNLVTWNLGTLAPGTSGSVSVTVQALSGPTLANSASLTATNAPSAAATATTAVTGAPRLVLAKSDAPDPVLAGGQIVYTLSFTNAGNADATAVVLTDTIPANTTFVSATGGANVVGNTITWNLGTVAAGAAGSVSLTVLVASPLPNGTVITNTASLTAANGPPAPDTTTTTVTAIPVLTLTKSSLPDPVVAGAELVYTLAYANLGSAPATGAALTDLLPPNTTFVSATAGGVFDGLSVFWALGTIAPGTSGSVSFTVRVANPLANGTVLANAASLASNETPTPVVATDPTVVTAAPVLAVSKVATPEPVEAGATVTYTISFANVGNDAATGVVLVDDLPPYTTFAAASGGGTFAGGAVTWSLGTLAAGAAGSVSMTLVVASPLTSGTLLTNTATLDSNETQPVTGQAVTTVASRPVITLAKIDDPDPVEAGGTLTYTLTFGNTGNADATAVVLTDALPAHVSFVAATGGGSYDALSGTVTWNLGTLAAGTSGSVSLTVAVASPLPNGTPLVNAAGIESAETPPASAQASTIVSSRPVLSLVKTASADPVAAGGTLVYTLAFANTGNADATGVALTDSLPAHTSFVAATAGGVFDPLSNVVTWTVGTLAAGGSGTVSFAVLVESPLANGTAIPNAAGLTSNETQPVTGVVVVRVTSAPVLTLSKSSTPEPVAAGADLIYTLSFANTGNDDATGAVLIDPLPANTSFVSATAGGLFDGVQVAWALGTIPAGTSGSVAFTVRVASPLANGTVVQNSASLTSDQTPLVVAVDPTAVTSAPVLVLSKVATPEPVEAGAALTYVISFANVGNDVATGVVLVDSLPPHTSFVVATGGGTEGPVGTVTWSLGTLAAGASGSVAVTVDVMSPLASGTLLTNTAALASDQTAPVTGQATTTVASRPVLSLSKVDAPDPVEAGGNLTYTLAFANSGNADASNVVLTDPLPAHTSFVAATGGGVFDAPANTVSWSLGTLAAGGAGSVSLTVAVDTPLADGTQLVNVAGIDSDETPNIGAEETTLVSSRPLLTLVKSASSDPVAAGGTLIYTLAFANIGNDTATGVVLTDSLPGNTTFISATGGGTYSLATNTITWSLGSLAAGASGAVAFTVTVASPLANGTLIPNAAGLTSNETQPVAAVVAVRVASAPLLALSKSAAPEPVAAGGQLTYTLSFANIGTDAATAVVLSDPLPANTTFVSASSGGVYSAGTNTVTWSLGALAAGASGSVMLVLQVVSPLDNGTQIVNSATLDCAETTPVSALHSTPVTSAPVLTLSKSCGPDPVLAAAQITCTLTYANIGNTTATAVVISDPVPAHTSFFSADNGGTHDVPTNTVNWSLPDLPAGGSGSVTLVLTVGSALANGTLVLNTGTIDSAETTPTSAQASVTVSSSPLLTLMKTAAPDPVVVGGLLTFTLSYANVGTDSATGVVLTDPIPAHTSFVSAPAGVFSAVTNTVTWSLPPLAAGGTGAVTLTVQVDSPLADGTTLLNAAGIVSTETPPVVAPADPRVLAPVLSLVKTAAPEPVPAGELLTYTLDYANTGSATATSSSLVDTLPPLVDFVSASGGGVYNGGAHTVTWTLGSLAPGASGFVTLTVSVPLTTGSSTVLVNAARLASDQTVDVAAAAVSTVLGASVVEIPTLDGLGLALLALLLGGASLSALRRRPPARAAGWRSSVGSCRTGPETREAP